MNLTPPEWLEDRSKPMAAEWRAKIAERARARALAERVTPSVFVNGFGWVSQASLEHIDDRSRLSWAERGVLIGGKEE